MLSGSEWIQCMIGGNEWIQCIMTGVSEWIQRKMKGGYKRKKRI